MRGVSTILLNPVANLFTSAANTTVLQNGSNAQAFQIYNTTDGTNTEFMQLDFSTNTARIFTSKAGSGTNRDLAFGAGGTEWSVNATTGNLAPLTDNTRALGTSALRLSDLQTKQITIGQSLAGPTVGAVTLSGAAGSAIVYTSAFTTGDRVFLSKAIGAGTQGHVAVTTSNVAGQFTVASSSTTDTSTVVWWIVHVS